MRTQRRSAGAELDPDIRRFSDGIAEAYATGNLGPDATLQERRALAEDVRKPWRMGGPVMAETVEHSAGAVQLRLHRPTTTSNLPLLIYIHGGGWVLFSMDTHDRLMREYAARTGVAVLGVDYSLSPEHKFPVALKEIDEIVDWIEQSGAQTFSIDQTRVAIGGDSAGANLSVATCIKRRQAGKDPLAGMLLSYGAFDPKHYPSYETFDGPPYTLEADEMDAFWDHYITSSSELDDPLVAPINDHLASLPPAHLTIADCDILADSNAKFAEKMRARGGSIEVERYAGATHSFLEAMSISALANDALVAQAEWLKKILESD